ncbi:unnamed protein product [Paramecium sonneborni]|uniref:Uncharacterized protein n=1 Tax=Paramecium sonneborni TaxID=65129 RepID=A0A8S1JU80_9CILI|nr:unnamed protein product [Paramecium sonneborni]
MNKQKIEDNYLIERKLIILYIQRDDELIIKSFLEFKKNKTIIQKQKKFDFF